MDIRSLSVLIIFGLLISSFGCIEESSEEITTYDIGLRCTLYGRNGVDNTTENLETLQDMLQKNNSIDVSNPNSYTLVVYMDSWSNGSGLNITETETKASIEIYDDEIKVSPYVEYTDDDLRTDDISEVEIVNSTKDLLMKNWSWVIGRVKKVYDAYIVSIAGDTNISTEL